MINLVFSPVLNLTKIMFKFVSRTLNIRRRKNCEKNIFNSEKILEKKETQFMTHGDAMYKTTQNLFYDSKIIFETKYYNCFINPNK